MFRGLPRGARLERCGRGTLAYLGASVFDPVSLSVTASIPLRIHAVHPSGRLAYGFVVPRIGSPTPDTAVLGTLDTRTNTVVATLPVPFEAAGLALDPAGTRLYVTGRTPPGWGTPTAAWRIGYSESTRNFQACVTGKRYAPSA